MLYPSNNIFCSKTDSSVESCQLNRILAMCPFVYICILKPNQIINVRTVASNVTFIFFVRPGGGKIDMCCISWWYNLDNKIIKFNTYYPLFLLLSMHYSP